MLRSDSSELSSDQARGGAGQGRHKVTRKIEFRTSPRKRGGDSLNTVRNKLKKTEKQHLVTKDNQPEAKTNHVLPNTEDMETDQAVLGRRAKQIELGKNTLDYDKYVKLVQRVERNDFMPRTPNKYKKYGRRRWDGAVRTWKQQIHTTITGLEEGHETTHSQEQDWKLEDRLGCSWAEEVEEELSKVAVAGGGGSCGQAGDP